MSNGEVLGYEIVDNRTGEQLTSVYPHTMLMLMCEFAWQLRRTRGETITVQKVERHGDEFYRREVWPEHDVPIPGSTRVPKLEVPGWQPMAKPGLRSLVFPPRAPRAIPLFRIVGLLGDISAGKGETAKYLTEQHRFIERNFADENKATVHHVFRVTRQEIAEYGKEKVIPRLGKSLRELYENMGTEGSRDMYPDVWIDHVAAKIERDRLRFQGPHAFVVSDVRFHNEVAWIRAQGGEVWQIKRPGHAPAPRQHRSDNEWRDIRADQVIYSETDNLPTLHANIEAALRWYGIGKLTRAYGGRPLPKAGEK